MNAFSTRRIRRPVSLSVLIVPTLLGIVSVTANSASAVEINDIGAIRLSDYCACNASRTANAQSSDTSSRQPFDIHAHRLEVNRYRSTIRIAEAEVASAHRRLYEYERFRYSNAFVITKERQRLALLDSQLQLDQLRREQAYYMRQHKRNRCGYHCAMRHAPSLRNSDETGPADDESPNDLPQPATTSGTVLTRIN